MPRTFKDPFFIDGISFNTGVDDADGVEWYCDTLDGWEDTTEPEIETVQFGYSDGVAMSDRSPLAARYVEFSGVVVAPTRELAQIAFRRLQGALDPNVFFKAERHGPIPESMIMRLAGKVNKPQDLGHAFRFATTLIAPWPYKQGLTPKGGSAGVFTGGEFVRVYPRVYPLVYFPSVDDPTTTGTETARNRITDPYAVTVGTAATGDWGTRWFGTGGAGNHTRMTGQAGGPTMPDGRTLTAWMRKNWTTASTASASDLGYSLSASWGSTATTGFAVTPGQTFSVGVLGRRSWTGGQWRINVQYRDAAGAALGAAVVGASQSAVAANTWAWVVYSGTVPASAVYADVIVEVTYSNATVIPAGQWHDVAAGYVMTGTTPKFVAGDMTSPDNGTTQYSWVAAAGASESVEVVLSTTITPPTATSVDIYNAGNASAWPIIKVTGALPANSWYLVNDATGEQQTFALAIGTGQTLIIDERTQSATLEGQVVDFYVRGDWLYLPANSTSTLRLVTTENYPGAGLEVTAYDTWK